MRATSQITLFFAFCSFSFAGCIPFNQAPQHVGETRCIKGEVERIDAGEPGFMRLSFCKDPGKCPLTALVSNADIQKAGGAHALQGKMIRIKGLLNRSDRNAQVVLRQPGQLSRDQPQAPSLMEGFDAGERGHYSAGTSRAPKVRTTTTTQDTATLPIDVPEDAEEAGPAR